MSKLKIEWESIFDTSKTFIGWIDLCNGTMFRLTAFPSLVPKPSLFVALEGRGNYYFSQNGSIKHPNYVAEKLSIPVADAEPLADWINRQMLFGEIEHQFGEYPCVQNLIDHYKEGGERETPVLIPRISSHG